MTIIILCIPVAALLDPGVIQSVLELAGLCICSDMHLACCLDVKQLRHSKPPRWPSG